MPSHSHDNPKQSKNNLMLLYSYLYLLPYILRLPQINSENKPSLSEDALINYFLLCLKYPHKLFRYMRCVLLKVIWFDPFTPVKITALLLPVEWKMPHFISYNEYLEPICKKLSSTLIIALRNNDFGWFWPLPFL